MKIVCWDCGAKHDLEETAMLLDGSCEQCGGAFNRHGHAKLLFEPGDTETWRDMAGSDDEEC